MIFQWVSQEHAADQSCIHCFDQSFDHAVLGLQVKTALKARNKCQCTCFSFNHSQCGWWVVGPARFSAGTCLTFGIFNRPQKDSNSKGKKTTLELLPIIQQKLGFLSSSRFIIWFSQMFQSWIVLLGLLLDQFCYFCRLFGSYQCTFNIQVENWCIMICKQQNFLLTDLWI